MSLVVLVISAMLVLLMLWLFCHNLLILLNVGNLGTSKFDTFSMLCTLDTFLL